MRDPWADVAIRPAATRGDGRQARVVVAALLGASGTVLRLLGHGPEARRSAVVLLVVAALCAHLWTWELTSGRWRRWLALAAVIAGGAVVTLPSVGRAPVLIVVASVFVGCAALVRWQPTRNWPARRPAVAGLAVPPIVIAQIMWLRSGVLGRTSLLLLAAGVAVEAYHRFPVPMERLDHLVRRGVGAIARAVGSAALLVIALPLFYLPGLIVRSVGIGPFGRRRRSVGSTWIPLAESAGRAIDGARLPFIVPDRRLARRRHVAALVAVLVVVLVVGTYFGLTRSNGGPPAEADPGEGVEATQLDLLESVPFSERPAMAAAGFADDLQSDLAMAQLEPHPATGYLTADTTTRYVNVRDGIRQTVEGVCRGCPRVDVWLVGASVVFGVGQRDDGTIGSALVRLAAEDGIDLHITNLSAPGWTLHQEANWLRYQLSVQSSAPDLVVFIDGFNDVASAVARDVVGSWNDDEPLVFNEEEMVEALQRTSSLGDHRVRSIADHVVRSYQQEQNAIVAELGALGIPSQFYFQPDAFASTRQLDVVRGMYDEVPAVIGNGELGAVAKSSAEGLSETTEDLREIYDEVDSPLFLDVVHTNEAGAQLLAEVVHRSLRAELLQLAAAT